MTRNIPCKYKDLSINIEIKKEDTVASLRKKITSNLNIDPLNTLLYLSNEKLSDDKMISDLKIDENDKNILVISSLKPLNKRKIHISSTEEQNKVSFLKREMKVIITNSDNINAVLAAKNILDIAFQAPISDILSKSVHCPYILSYIFNIFKAEIAETIEKKHILTIFNECSDLKLVGHILNYLAEVNESSILSFLHQLNITERFFLLLEHLNFANKPAIIKKIISKIPKYKYDLTVVAPSLIIFFNNVHLDDKEYFQTIFIQIRDLKRAKYKNSSEIRMLLLAISIKCDKAAETLKHYEKLLNVSIEKPKLTKAVLSTIYTLFIISKNKEPKLIDRETIETLLKQIPQTYEQQDFIQYLLQASFQETPDIYKEDDNSKEPQNPPFSKILEFSFTHNFLLILKSQLVKETFLTNTFSWLANGISYMSVFKMIYDSNPDFQSAINCLFLIYSTSCPTISTSTFSPSVKTYLHHHAYYPSQLIDSIFFLLTMLVDSLPKNESVVRVDSRYIFEFSFLFLLRPDLSLQKSALKIIKKVSKYKNNDDIDNFVGDTERRSKKKNMQGQVKEKENGLYKILIDQLNDNSFSDLTESCRIIRGALCYFIKSPSFFREDVFNLALVTSGHSLDQKFKYLQDLQNKQLMQLQDHLKEQRHQKESQHQQSQEDDQRSFQKQSPQSNTAQNKKSKSNSKPKLTSTKAQPASSPIVPPSPIPILNSQTSSSPQSASSVIDELSYSYIFLKILLDQISNNFQVYLPFLKTRLEFTSIAFSFLSFGGNSPDLRELFLNFISESKLITNDEKLEILFRFVQNERKLEHKQKRQSDSQITTQQIQQKNIRPESSSQISSSADTINDLKHRLSVINSNLDFSCYEREMNIIFKIMKAIKDPNLISGDFSIEKYCYFYIISQLSVNKLFKNCFEQLVDKSNELFSNPKTFTYEIIRFAIFNILFNLNNRESSLLLPQINTKSITDFLRKQNHENKRFFKHIFRYFLIDDDEALKKAICLVLSSKSHQKIDFTLPCKTLLKEHPKRAVRTLFTILSTQFISEDMIEKVTKYLKYFLKNDFKIDSKNVSYLIGAKKIAFYSLFENAFDEIKPYLPYFMIKNVFTFDLWEKIAKDHNENIVLQCIVSTFSSYSSYLSYLTYNGENSEDYEDIELVIDGCKLAYKLFDVYGVKKSKSWQIVCLSLLFNEPNEFALNHLIKIINDNDKLKNIKKSPIFDHFDKPIENLLNNESKVEIISAILEIIPFVRKKHNFNTLFTYIQSENSFNGKEILNAIDTYCSFNEKLTASALLLKFLISKVDDENKLRDLLNSNNPTVRKYSYDVFNNSKSGNNLELLNKLVKEGKQHFTCLSKASNK